MPDFMAVAPLDQRWGPARPDPHLRFRFTVTPNLRVERFPPWMPSRDFLGPLAATTALGIAAGSRYALAFRYSADRQSREKEDEVSFLLVLANLAAWIARPSALAVGTVLFVENPGPRARSMGYRIHEHVIPRAEEVSVSFTRGDFARWQKILAKLGDVHPPGSVFRSITALLTGLRSRRDVRYLLVWLALEALFGPQDPRETTHRIAERIALFLSRELRQPPREVYRQVKRAYDLRSQVVHGREVSEKHRRTPGTSEANSEQWARLALRKILGRAALTATFSNEGERDAYLDGLALGRS